MTACLCYLDDLTFTMSMDAVRESRDIAVTWLGRVELRLNMSKCRVFTLAKKSPMEDWWKQVQRHDGLLICGARKTVVDFDFELVDQVFPEGETSFMAVIAKRCQDKIVEAREQIEQLLRRQKWDSPRDRQRMPWPNTVLRQNQHRQQ